MGDGKGLSGYHPAGTYSEGIQDFSNGTDLRKHDPERECIRKYAAVQVLCLPGLRERDPQHGGSGHPLPRHNAHSAHSGGYG